MTHIWTIKVKKFVTNVEFSELLISTILSRLSGLGISESGESCWESAAGLIGASQNLLNFCSNNQINILYNLSLKYLDHQECRVRKGTKGWLIIMTHYYD